MINCKVCGCNDESRVIQAIEIPKPIYKLIAHSIQSNHGINTDIWTFLAKEPLITFNGCIVQPKEALKVDE